MWPKYFLQQNQARRGTHRVYGASPGQWRGAQDYQRPAYSCRFESDGRLQRAGHGEDPFANRVTKWSNRYPIRTLGTRLNHLSIIWRSPKYPERRLFAKP